MAGAFIEFHRWRGFSKATDKDRAVVVFGLITVGAYRGSIFDKLRKVLQAGGR